MNRARRSCLARGGFAGHRTVRVVDLLVVDVLVEVLVDVVLPTGGLASPNIAGGGLYGGRFRDNDRIGCTRLSHPEEQYTARTDREAETIDGLRSYIPYAPQMRKPTVDGKASEDRTSTWSSSTAPCQDPT